MCTLFRLWAPTLGRLCHLSQQVCDSFACLKTHFPFGLNFRLAATALAFVAASLLGFLLSRPGPPARLFGSRALSPAAQVGRPSGGHGALRGGLEIEPVDIIMLAALRRQPLSRHKNPSVWLSRPLRRLETLAPSQPAARATVPAAASRRVLCACVRPALCRQDGGGRCAL